MLFFSDVRWPAVSWCSVHFLSFFPVGPCWFSLYSSFLSVSISPTHHVWPDSAVSLTWGPNELLFMWAVQEFVSTLLRGHWTGKSPCNLTTSWLCHSECPAILSGGSETRGRWDNRKRGAEKGERGGQSNNCSWTGSLLPLHALRNFCVLGTWDRGACVTIKVLKTGRLSAYIH